MLPSTPLPFQDDGNDKGEIDDVKAIEAAEEMLGCGNLTSNLTTRTMSRGGGPGRRASTYTIDYSKPQCDSARDAVTKVGVTAA